MGPRFNCHWAFLIRKIVLCTVDKKRAFQNESFTSVASPPPQRSQGTFAQDEALVNYDDSFVTAKESGETTGKKTSAYLVKALSAAGNSAATQGCKMGNDLRAPDSHSVQQIIRVNSDFMRRCYQNRARGRLWLGLRIDIAFSFGGRAGEAR